MVDQASTVPSVFISYTGADRQLVKSIREGLERNGTAVCFTFERDIRMGQNIVEEVREHLSRTTHFLCVVTQESINRPWVRHEINTALLRYLQGECTILLVLRGLDDSDLPCDLRQFDHVQVVDVDTAVFEVVDAVSGARKSKPRQRWDFWRRHPRNPDVFQLLSWHVRLTKLYSRDGELDELLAWACDEANEPRVRVVTGPGGIGKTRLAAELCDSLWQGGWEVDFLDFNRDVTPSGLGTLWVVDYPEEKQGELGEFLISLKARRSGSIPVRVLMLSRQPEEWWFNNSEIKRARAAHLFDTFDLKLVGLGATDTVAMFREACTNLCEWYGRESPHISDNDVVLWRQKAEFHSMPLMIVAAALHAVLDPDEALGLMGREVIQSLVKRERARLDVIGEETAKLMGYGRDGVEPTWGSRLYGLSAASSGIDSNMLRALAQPELEFGLPEPRRVVDLARRLPIYAAHAHPPQIEVPRPDIFGAALLYDVLSDRSDKAPDWLWIALSHGKNFAQDNLVDRLGRLIYDVSTVCIGKDMKFVEWLLEMIRDNPERAHLLESVVLEEYPPDSVLPLSIEVNRYMASEDNVAPEIRAERLTNLALHLVRGKRHTEAEKLASEAVCILRERGASGKDCQKSLANALRVLSMSSESMNSTKAVNFAEEATGVYRMLSEEDTENLRDLASALNTLGIALQTAGKRQESVLAFEESVSISRQLVRQNESPERHLALMDYVARGLHNLSHSYWVSEKRDEALEAIRESVSIRRGLYAESRWRYGRYLALSLVRLAPYLSAIGEHEHADDAFKQAIAIRKRLATANPGQFGVELVSTMSERAKFLMAAGRKADAMTVYEEETEAFHDFLDHGTLTADTPTLETLTMELAGIIGYNAVEANHPEAAIQACNEVVDLIERVRSEKIEQWGPNLQLNLLAAYLNRGNAHRKTSEGRQRAIADYTHAIEEGKILVSLPDREPAWVVYLEVALMNRCLERLTEGDDMNFDDYRATLQLEQDLRQEMGQDWPTPEHYQLVKSLKVLVSRLKEKENYSFLEKVAERLAETAIALVKSRKINLEGDNTIDAARKVMQVGDTLFSVGSPEAAVPIVRKGIELVDMGLSQKTGVIEGKERAAFLNNVGYPCAELAAYVGSLEHAQKAEGWLREAMNLLGHLDNSELSGQLCDSLGFVLTVRAELSKEAGVALESRSLLQRSLEIFREMNSDSQASIVREHITRLDAAFPE